MPDFTIVNAQQCTNNFASGEINGYTCFYNKKFEEFYCDCADFIIRKKKNGEMCKHLKELSKEVCGWHSMYSDERQNSEQERNYICPACGSATEAVKVAT